jgi:hypothetical protein
MNIISLIQSFKAFEIGDFVVCNNKLMQIIMLPRFRYTVNYYGGDFDVFYTQDFTKVSGDYMIVGYCIKFIDGNSKFDLSTHHFLITNYEKYDPNVHLIFSN